MPENRREKRRARKIQKALDIPYTRALRIYRSIAIDNVIDWETITDERLIELFSDVK